MTKFWLLLIVTVVLQLGGAAAREQKAPKIEAVDAADLPKEARTTLALIALSNVEGCG